LETFDAGPTLVLIQDPQQHQRVEVTVEPDDLSENEDEIEVSIHLYKDEQLQPLPILPRLTFRMQEKNKIWRLNEFTIAGHGRWLIRSM
jgi:hypothetical protein